MPETASFPCKLPFLSILLLRQLLLPRSPKPLFLSVVPQSPKAQHIRGEAFEAEPGGEAPATRRIGEARVLRRFWLLALCENMPRRLCGTYMGVSENRGPYYNTPNSRILIIRTPN